MNTWLQLSTGPGEPAWNMALDEALLEFSRNFSAPVLRFYSWKIPAATFGLLQKYSDAAGWTELRPLVRRPTAGGLVSHRNDWTYSFVVPTDHEWYSIKAEESYRRMHSWINRAFGQLNLSTQLAASAIKEAAGRCFIGAEKFDLIHNSKKIAGAAQRRNKLGLLIQGSIQEQPANVQRSAWEEAMRKTAIQLYQCSWKEAKLPAELLQRANILCQEKYSRDEYNERR